MLPRALTRIRTTSRRRRHKRREAHSRAIITTCLPCDVSARVAWCILVYECASAFRIYSTAGEREDAHTSACNEASYVCLLSSVFCCLNVFARVRVYVSRLHLSDKATIWTAVMNKHAPCTQNPPPDAIITIIIVWCYQAMRRSSYQHIWIICMYYTHNAVVNARATELSHSSACRHLTLLCDVVRLRLYVAMRCDAMGSTRLQSGAKHRFRALFKLCADIGLSSSHIHTHAHYSRPAPMRRSDDVLACDAMRCCRALCNM